MGNTQESDGSIKMTVVKEWVFKDAQELVAAMRSKTHQYGYEIAMGGSVLTNGKSSKDLDLFFVPKGGDTQPLPIDLLMWVASKLGPGKTIVPAFTSHPNGLIEGTPMKPAVKDVFLHKMRFDLAGRKIDVFVV